jgi:predicted AAA+ superfamily ATPase
MKQAITIQNPHWTGAIYKNLQERTEFKNLLANLETKHIQILTGIRRSGKSTLFRMLINELLKTTNPKSILLLNMDDPQYYEIWENPALFYSAIETAEILTGVKIKYLFLDEVQAVKNWETFVKSAYDSELFNKIFITGSNSSFLNNEYSTLLSGRYLANNIFPFSLKELFIQNEINDTLSFYQNKANALRIIDNCLEWGCFPEIKFLKNIDTKNDLLKSYFDSIIMKDCVSRYQISDIAAFKKMLLYIVSNAGSVYSYNSLGKAVSSNEHTVKKYIEILNDSYIIQDVANFAFSIKENVRNMHKIFFFFFGLINAVAYRFWYNRAKLFENFVFNELQKQQHDEITFANNTGECDFVIKDGFEYSGVQVCYEVNEENIVREFGGFDTLKNDIKLTKKTIVTYNQELTTDNVEVVPIGKWIFEN